MDIEIVDLQEADLNIVKEIYDYYIINSTATFHTDLISVEELKSFIKIGHPKYKSFLIERDNKVCGYCYFAAFKPRQAYDRTAEITIYLKPEYSGKGIGKQTLELLHQVALDNDIFVLLGVITGENTASIRLFEKCGYVKCAHYKKIGKKFNRLLDVVVYQKLLSDSDTDFVEIAGE